MPRIALAALLPALAGCVTNSGPPPEGGGKTVLLLRVTTEVEGRATVPFPGAIPDDNIWLGLGGFSTGGKLKPAALRFLSADTREDGWTYLTLDPGVYYLGAVPPRSTDVWTYNAQWQDCPRWRIEIPSHSGLVYGGTLFLPGKGRWMIFGPRQLEAFDRGRIAVRDESARAAALAESWFPARLPMDVQLLRKHKPGETIILQTPPGD